MKNSNHPIDNLFREALAEHTIVPSDGARKTFLKDAAALPAAGNKRKKGLFWLSGLSFLALLGFVTWLLFPSASHDNHMVKDEMPASIPVVSVAKAPTVTSESAAEEAAVSSKPVNNTRELNINSPTSTIKKQSQGTRAKDAIHPQPVQPQDHKPATTVATTTTTTTTNTSAKTKNPVPAIVIAETKATSQQEKKEAPEINTASAALPPAQIDAEVKGLNEAMSPQKNLSTIDNADNQPLKRDSLNDIRKILPAPADKKSRTRGRINTTLGIYYTPEWMFNTLEGVKFVNNFGLEGVFRYGPFSIKTGAGLSVSKGTNEVTVEYNDYLGAYNKLDSMDFTWNDPSHQYIPTYYLSRQDVWDSLLKIDNAKIIKRYTYLQIPLIFGYDFMENERFSFGVRVGPTMSVLLKTKQLSEEYNPGNKRIIRVNDIAPEQINLNWQVMAGLNGAVRLSKRVKFEVEPSVRYYFNSVYEKPVNYTKPWSIGIKGGFLLDL